MTSRDGDPGLLGRTVVVAGAGDGLLEIVQALVDGRALIAVVSSDHDLVATATDLADASGLPVLGLTSDPARHEVWTRNAPHIEQRLGPIDAVIAVGPPELRDTVERALAPDLAARRHGVFVAVSDLVDAAAVLAQVTATVEPQDG